MMARMSYKVFVISRKQFYVVVGLQYNTFGNLMSISCFDRDRQEVFDVSYEDGILLPDTGLVDAESRSIYDSDILQLDGGDKYTVYWDEQCAGFMMRPIDEIGTNHRVELRNARLWKKIGNVYENMQVSKKV